MSSKVVISPAIVDAGHVSNIENGPAFERMALEWLLPKAAAGEAPRHWPAR